MNKQRNRIFFVPGLWITDQQLLRRTLVHKQYYSTPLLQRFFLLLISIFFSFSVFAQKQTGTLKISFINTVNGIPLVLNDSVYNNSFKETYSISKLKYYISNVRANKASNPQKEKNSYHLVNAADTTSLHFSFSLKSGNYTSFDFLLGVDSLRNCSGAQSGALDPLNDMFWTWNSGYVMFKLEGSSPQSGQVNNRIEYHIGGYAGANNVIKKISLPAAFEVIAGNTTELIIETDINKLWLGPNDISIVQSPVCSTPGALAKKVAANYSKMFSLKNAMIIKN